MYYGKTQLNLSNNYFVKFHTHTHTHTHTQRETQIPTFLDRFCPETPNFHRLRGLSSISVESVNHFKIAKNIAKLMMFGTLDCYKMFNIDCICSGIFHYTTKEFDE